MDPKSNDWCLMRREDAEMRSEGAPVTMEAEIGATQRQARNAMACLQPPGARRQASNGPSPEASRQIQPCGRLEFGLLDAERMISAVLNHPVCCSSLRQPQDRSTASWPWGPTLSALSLMG